MVTLTDVPPVNSSSRSLPGDIRVFCRGLSGFFAVFGAVHQCQTSVHHHYPHFHCHLSPYGVPTTCLLLSYRVPLKSLLVSIQCIFVTAYLLGKAYHLLAMSRYQR
jgi:hypothetical protein